MIITMGGEKYQVLYTEDPITIDTHITHDMPKFITYDTESTGLHIKKDKPFLGAVCWHKPQEDIHGLVYVFPTVPEILRYLPKWASMVNRVYAHNTTYDMHMTANIMGDDFPIQITNWGDTMGLARLSFEAVSVREGGDSLALKTISNKYIDPDADRFEKAKKAWLAAKRKHNQKVLESLLHNVKDENGRKWSYKRLVDAINKGTETVSEEVLNIYQQWRAAYPEPTHKDVPMEIMLPYVATDVILTNILVRKALRTVVYREQQKIMEKEFSLINVIYDMERQGIQVDREYLEEANYKVSQYINDLYAYMYELTGGVEISVNQHAKIKEIYTKKLGEAPKSTDKKFLNQRKNSGDQLAEIISELRRLEKWKSTYIEKILEDSAYDGRFYTQLNQFNPISGRFSGDAQQFPKDAIFGLTQKGWIMLRLGTQMHKIPKEERVEIYHPRKAFVGEMAYIDYSQVELRMQAHHTLEFGGDLNLCRAYMPFKCIHYKTGEMYSYTTVEERKRWEELREDAPEGLHWEKALEDGWSAWIVPETGQPWIPTDVHGSTTIKALDIIRNSFLDLAKQCKERNMMKDYEEYMRLAEEHNIETMDKDTFKWWRNIGKRFNFMRNYGGGDYMASEVLEIPLEHAQAMNRGYTEAFPLVITYQNDRIYKMHQQGYVENMYGRRYYLSKSRFFYKVANYDIQGPCADMLKEKMLEIANFIKEHGLKVRMILCVHDELQFARNGESEEKWYWALKNFKRIMEDTPHILVPIVAEVDETKTNWAEKSKVVGL